ncbi:putative multidrug resistance protein NorM [Anaerocolumna cellulosilytica]|uniref:Probable multidrug resistance protein NorM n=1 Tax=Anaerocolumna cellulosilytica TaxID=433286 RepID=A0A6S6R317_9FIRM|nr:MATE family efflux transporter [Anaerocolumna cellulosilytica]MBB5195982.1 putative MATE family efflux protein [Anaerocolumna cellulosilytica]BCJ93720.1 putative multidrug resistance protein NorM [Anaerocolumna cellulosilytica]
MFNNKQLKKLIIPLIIEQLLAVTVGMADIMMVARAGETAVSGVSLVDTLNVLLITLFSSLATGGAVVAAQYLGHKETKEACKAANQLLLAVGCISLLIMGISLIGNQAILRTIYGSKVEKAVMDNAVTYFYITALSFPFLAIYNSCAALFRTMGNSKVSMMVSIIMNIINVGGNAILILGFRMGVAGVAYPTLVSRAVAAVIMLGLIHNAKNPIHISNIFHQRFDWKMIRRILNIGVPNGLENSVFQIGKVLVQGITASFGTVAITANAVGNTIAGLEVIPGSAIGLAMITVVGQCVGAGDLEQAKKYVIKLMKITYIIIIILNMGVLLLREPIIGLYNLSSETEALAMQLVIYHSICCCIIWPISFCLPNALRAANDVKNTMLISIISMWVWRIGFSFILAYSFKLGLMGVWIAMTIDWLFRGICFVTRFLSGKWKRHAYIS